MTLAGSMATNQGHLSLHEMQVDATYDCTQKL